MPGVALDHLVRSLEAGGGDVGHGEALVVRLVGAQHRGVRHQREVNPMSRSATVIQTRQLYRQVQHRDIPAGIESWSAPCNYIDRSVIQTSSAQGLTSGK